MNDFVVPRMGLAFEGSTIELQIQVLTIFQIDKDGMLDQNSPV